MTQKEQVCVQITAGQGPAECALAVRKLSDHLQKQAVKAGLVPEMLDHVLGEKSDIYDSVLISISGSHAKDFVEPWRGTIQWSCPSPYRPNHKRKNWFVGVSLLPIVSNADIDINTEDVTWKAVRASGPGGQHVNTTDSAVQAFHRPTGIRVTASEERSQHANKKRALAKIAAVLLSRQEERKRQQAKEQHEMHNDLIRGNPVKVFVGLRFKER